MIPVILSGGSGTRLWPVSRENYPKQFCEFYDKSFMVNTIERLSPFGEPYLLTIKTMQALSIRVSKELDFSKDHIIYEPYAKNTGPAVALMCHLLSLQGKGDEIVGFFPADHLIVDTEAFQESVKLAISCAEEGQVVTLGIHPNYPSTGYGYIESTDQVLKQAGDVAAYKANRFLEKPDAVTAQKFVDGGKHFWNAGMFVFKVNVMVELFKKHLPQVWEKISAIELDMSNAKYQYANTENISFDYGIMEKLESVTCIPCKMGWSDVGSWDEIARISEEIPDLKVDSHARVFGVDSQNNYVFSVEDKVIGLIDVEDLIVVDTEDALLVTHKGSTQKVKQLVQNIKEMGLTQATEHRFEKRPWGKFEILKNDEFYKSKIITVEAGEKLSYQSHKKRQEHWVVVEGEAFVILDGKEHTLGVGESIMIPTGAKHRIGNKTERPMRFVEVQTGTYFGEDDITRYEDDYERT